MHHRPLHVVDLRLAHLLVDASPLLHQLGRHCSLASQATEAQQQKTSLRFGMYR